MPTGHYKRSEESNKKRSESLKGRIITDESKAKSKATRATRIYPKRVVLEETRQKISKALLGRIVPKETGAKISKVLTGKKQSAEHKEKNRIAHTGLKCSPESIIKGNETRHKTAEKQGYWHSPETRNKIGESNSISLKGNIPWNTGLTKETNDSVAKMSVAKIVPRELRKCLCGCGETKLVTINSKWKYFAGHCTSKSKNKDTKTELKMKDILNEIGYIKNIDYITQYTIPNISNNFICDFYIKKYNLLIDTDGQYWHCNPEKFKADDYNTRVKKYAKEIWAYDENRANIIKEAGYNFFRVWENKFNTETIKNIINKAKEEIYENSIN